MPKYTKLTLNQVRSIARQNGSISIRVVACNMYPVDMWSIDLILNYDPNVHGVLTVDGKTVINAQYNDVPLSFNTWLDNWKFSNATPETGMYAHYYRIT